MMTLHDPHTPDNTNYNSYNNNNTSPSVATTPGRHSNMFPPSRSSPPQGGSTFTTFAPLMSNHGPNNYSGTNSQINPSNIWNTNNGSIPHVQRRHSAIDTNIWSQGASNNLPPATTATTTNIWSQGPSPNQENYTSSLSNRSSSISGFTPPPLEEQQQQVNHPKSILSQFQAGSPSKLLDPVRRHSFADALPTTNTAGSNSNVLLNGDTNQTLKLVDEYFETDPHERVKVTLRLLNERFFDEEKYLGDAYQLPKFPIESSLRNYQLILVGFKAGRIDVFYLPSVTSNSDLNRLKIGDLVIVEADRGRDLGKVFKMNISIDEARLLKLLQFQEQQAALNEHENILDDLSVKSLSDCNNSIAPPTLHFPKSIISLAQPNEILQILNKKQDEEKACRLCLAKIANATSSQQLMGANSTPSTNTQDLLQMKLIDAEYQFDRKKLIFYYSTSKRIDFRDLVRELFRIYKTRIWMCAVIGLPYAMNRKSVSPLMSGATSNPFMQQQHQQQQQQQQHQQSQQQQVQQVQPQQITFGRGFERRLSYQPPPTFQQYPNTAPPTHLPQQQHQQPPQLQHPFQDGIPRRFSDTRPFQQSQYSMFQQQPNIQQGMNQLSPFQTDFQFPPPPQASGVPPQQGQNRNDGTIKEEEDSNNSSGEAFVLKSLVDSINH